MEITVRIEYQNTRLKELRESAGLSQSKLAAVTGLNVRTLQDYEQGRKNLNGAKLVTLLQLCKALGCKLSALVSDPECLALLRDIYGDEPGT